MFFENALVVLFLVLSVPESSEVIVSASAQAGVKSAVASVRPSVCGGGVPGRGSGSALLRA